MITLYLFFMFGESQHYNPFYKEHNHTLASCQKRGQYFKNKYYLNYKNINYLCVREK